MLEFMERLDFKNVKKNQTFDEVSHSILLVFTCFIHLSPYLDRIKKVLVNLEEYSEFHKELTRMTKLQPFTDKMEKR